MSTTTRILKWQAALEQIIAERMAVPFVWVTNDCVVFPADCVKAMTGEDPIADVRGTYSDANSAAHKLAEFGGMAEFAAAHFGEEVSRDMAQVGDVVMVDSGGHDSLAIYAGSRIVLGTGAEGLVRIPIEYALRVWRCTKA